MRYFFGYILLVCLCMFGIGYWKLNKPAHKEQYTELFECYDKKFGYYEVQEVVCDLYFSRDIDKSTAMILHSQIDSLHKIELNKIESLNKIIDGK